MGAIASQITSLTIVYSIVYSDADQRKHESSASLALVRGIHRGPVNSPHKWPVTRKMFPFDDVITSPVHRTRKVVRVTAMEFTGYDSRYWVNTRAVTLTTFLVLCPCPCTLNTIVRFLAMLGIGLKCWVHMSWEPHHGCVRISIININNPIWQTAQNQWEYRHQNYDAIIWLSDHGILSAKQPSAYHFPNVKCECGQKVFGCWVTWCIQGANSIQRYHLTSIGNPIMEIRRSYDHLISTMGFPILVRWHLHIESGPWLGNIGMSETRRSICKAVGL